MTVQSRILRSLARGETVLDFGRATADLGDNLAAARLNFDIGRLTAPLDVSADQTAPEASAPVPDDGGIESFLATNPQNHTDGGTLELDGASSIASADVGGFTYVFVAGSVDDGISVFRLNANGTLTPVHDVTDAGALELDGARGLSTAMVDGNTYLFAAGFDDNGVSVFRVGTNGSLTSVSDVTDDATMLLAGVSDTATARVGASTYLYTAGTTENGISIFRVAGDGRLTYLSNQADNVTFELAGVRALSTVIVGATSYLIAGGADDGISVFSINAATGALTNTANVNDAGGISLQDVSDITTAVIGGVTYVFIAGATDNGVSVYSLSAAGALTFVDNEADSAATLIAGANSVAVHAYGGVNFLLVGGNENGLSVYRIENGSNSGYAAGTLTWLDNIADGGSRELAGLVATGSGGVGGTTYILGAGQTDDGISAFGSTATGQLYFMGNGDPADTRLAYVNNDGGNQTSFVDNGPTQDLITTFPQEVGVDTAAGFYFALVNGGNDGSGGRLVRGSLSGGATTVLITYDGADNLVGTSDDEIVNAIHIDTINERFYIGIQDFAGDATKTGIREFSYNPLTGAITDLGWFINAGTDATKVTTGSSGFDLLDVRDFDIDFTTSTLYFTELLTGGAAAQGLYRMNMTTKAVTLMTSTVQFPTTFANGYIIDVEVDNVTNLVYFSTESQQPFGNPGYNAAHNAIWFLPEGATNGTATQLSLIGLPGGHHLYPGDMVFDQATRQLYVESDETDDTIGADTDDVIYVFQLNGAGTQGTLINTISLTPAVTSTAANLAGMNFNNIAALNGISGTASAIGEQGAAVQLLTGAPTITDADGDHLSSATVQVTGGLFSSNQSNATADRLFFGPTLGASGSVAGTSITWAYNSATNTLTFTGYDTLANYQTALAGVRFQSLTDNPTNYGLNATRTITWTVSDGALGVPGGSQNSATTTINITAVNDAPVNIVPGTQTISEDVAGVTIAGLQVSDPDANPGITDITVTLTVQHGTLTLLNNVAGGLTAADIAGNGSATVTITGTINEINATFSAATGVTYVPTANYNGADTLQMVANDGGNTGTGGPLSDTDNVTINITAVNDAPTVIDATQTAATILEDTPSAVGETVSSLFTTSFSDALDQQQTGGNPTGSVANTLAGIAVVGGSTGASGSWQYFNGAIWVNIGAASTASAVLISAATAIRFNPALNFNGSPPDLVVHLVDSSGAAITNGATVNLTGATGGITRYSSATVALSESVTAVNDAPVNTVGGTLTVAEDSVATAVTGISISDVDANPATDVFTVTLDVLHGTLNVLTSVPGGLGAGNVSGNGSATVILSGTINQINATLAAAGGLTYTPTGDYNGSDRVQVTTDDGGATGLDPGATGTATSEADVDSKTINVTAVNDPVSTGAPPTLTLDEDATNVAVAGLSISDVDAALAPAGVYDVTLASTNGTMTLTTLAGLTFTVGDGTSDATMTFHGTLAAINAALATAAYTPTAHYNGFATITLSATDTFGGIVATGTGAATADNDVIAVTINAVNDPISTAAPATLMLNEDATNVAVAGLSISDVDATLAPAGVYEVTLTSTNGTMTLTTLAGLTFTAGDGTSDATMTFHGTLADINTALATANYTPAANYNGSATITLNATDTFGGIVATGSGAATSDSDVINVTVNAVNDTPVVSLAATGSSTEQVAGTVDATATIADIDLDALNGGNGNYSGATLTIANNGGNDANDLFAIGTSGAFTVNGSNLESGGLVFATFSGGNGTPLVISFTSSGTAATTALANAVAQSIQYTYTGDNPPVAGIDVAVSLNDGAPANAGQGSIAGHPATGTDIIHLSITDTPENFAPVLDLNGVAAGDGSTAAVTEQSGPATLAPDLVVTDADDTDLTGATVTIGSPAAGDFLGVAGVASGTSGTISWAWNGTNTLTFTGTASLADYQALLRTVTFEANGDDPGTSRTISWSVTDGTDPSNTPTTVVTVTGLNDPPFLNAVGATTTFTEGDAPVDLFSAVNALNFEAGQTFTSLTLTVTNVTDGADEILGFDGSNVALTNGNSVTTATNGLTVTVTVAAGVATVTFSGAALTKAQLDTLVDAITYANTSQNPTDADRVITLTQVVDSGANGGGDVNNSNPNVAATVNVNPVNDTPLNTVPGTQTINEDGSVTLSTGNGNAIQVADADAGTLTVTLTVLHGTLTLASIAGLSFGAGDGTADTTMTFSGTAAAINAALGSGLAYNPNGDYNGSDSIAVFTTDNGQFGGPTQTDSDSIAVNITAVNDAPVVIGDGTESATTIDEDTPGAGQTIQALFAGQYSDAADNQIPNGGASSPGQFSGIAVTANGSSAATGQWQYFSGGVWTDIGAASDGAAKLLGDPFVTLIRFNPAPDYNGPAPTLTVHLIDNSLPFGIVNGQVVDLSGPGATGGTTAYSTGTVVLSQDVTAVNDSPLNNVPGAQTINEDASFTLSTGNGNAIQVADVDATTLTVILTVVHGTLTLASTAGLSFGAGDGTADATMTFSGTAAAINAALGSGLTYNPTANYNGPDSIAVLTTDNGQTGAGGTLQDNDSIGITVNSVNDEPAGADNTVTGSEDDPYVFTIADFGFSDPIDNNNFDGVFFTTVPTTGTLFYDADGPGGAAPVALTNGSFIIGPTAAADIAAGKLYFVPVADGFGSPYTSFTFQVHDDGGIANGGVNIDLTFNTMTINITPDNLPPAVDLDGVAAGVNYTTTFVEDGAAVAIGSGVSVTDPNSGIGDMIESATITLTDRVAGDSLTLTGALPPGITSATTNLAGSITITITGPGTGAQYQALIQSIQYATSSQDPTFGGTDLTRTVTVIVNDGLVDSAVATTTINVTTVDDPPTGGDDGFIITESGTIVGGNLFGNDGDVDGPALAIASVTGGPGANVGTQFTLASGALLTVRADGTFDYNPNGVFLPTPTPGSGASNTPSYDSFTYTLAGGTGPVTVTITLTGLDTDDTLLGTAGTDILAGGNGNDTYYVENGSDQVLEANGGGNDRVIASVSYALAAGSYVETLEAAAAAGPINLTGNEFDQLLLGNGSANVLFGGLGNDTLEGGGGADMLYGEGGDDISRGGSGDDIYVVDAAGDVTEELSFEGNDTVLTQVSYALTTGASVETLSTTVHAATTAINLIGNYLDQTIIGNYGANIITGGVGADVLIGLLGDDTYIIHDSTASVIEDAGGGNDLVYTSVSFMLGAGSQVEILSTTFHAGTAAIDLVGNSFAQAIYGNAAANNIRGGGGGDSLYGFAGNDTYFVSSAADQVFEQASSGADAVYTAGSYTLAAGQEIEFLSTDNFASTAPGINLTGNEFANTIYGNDGNNILDGKGGNDALVGLAGADTFAFTTALGPNNVDLVFGFQQGVDKIALDDAIFTAIGGLGTLDANAFHTGAAAHDATDRIIYNSATGQLYYDADGIGGMAAIQFATTSPGLALTASDFQVI
ncbi:MAG TPA: Ig-like domain-containing protein [Allosphingosinicella sp.]|nr:Ig-like domain-containing protein [Allosphingosinicella sp.]